MGSRRGFTLIELILAMIVMGIAFATLPAILGVSSRSVENVSDVRGLYHGIAKMEVVRGKPWDEVNTNDFNQSGIYYVLNTQECNVALTLCCLNNKSRFGHYQGLDRRMCENGMATPSANFLAEGDFDDIDDFNNDGDRNIEGYDINTTVRYINYPGGVNGGSVSFNTAVAAAGQSTNIKEITVSVSRTATGRAVSRYVYYATNIGVDKPFIKDN
jgi:prepilin-type N-terminal cleavage/methylation domain-containing protein